MWGECIAQAQKQAVSNEYRVMWRFQYIAIIFTALTLATGLYQPLKEIHDYSPLAAFFCSVIYAVIITTVLVIGILVIEKFILKTVPEKKATLSPKTSKDADKAQSDYELARAGFSATMGLGIWALALASPDTTNPWLKLALLLVGAPFWGNAVRHYTIHYKLRGNEGSLEKFWEWF